MTRPSFEQVAGWVIVTVVFVLAAFAAAATVRGLR